MNTDLNNIAHLCGTVESELKYSHDIFGESFYVFKLKVERLSGQADILPVTVSERLMNEEIKEGQRLSVDGQVGCETWTALTRRAVGIGRTSTVINP